MLKKTIYSDKRKSESKANFSETLYIKIKILTLDSYMNMTGENICYYLLYKKLLQHTDVC